MAGNTEDDAAPGSGTMERFDFRQTSTLPGPVARALEADLEALVPRVGLLVESMVRREVTASMETPARCLLGSLEADQSSWFRLALTATTSGPAVPLTDGIAVIDRPFVVCLAEMLMGGPGAPADRAPSSLERRLVASRLTTALTPLTDAFHDHGVARMELNPVDRDDLTSSREVALVTIRLTVGGNEGSLRLGLPLSLFVHGESTQGATDASPLLMAALGAVPLPVDLRFAPTRVSSTELEHLAVGDVIRLDHPADQPLVGMLQGHRIFLARPGRRGRKLAIEVESVLEEV